MYRELTFILTPQGSVSDEVVQIHTYIIQTIERIFQKHGALRLNAPLLMPRSDMYEYTDQYVTLMDHSGDIVALPFDLRVRVRTQQLFKSSI